MIFKTLVKLENLDGMDRAWVNFDLKPKQKIDKNEDEDSSDYDEGEKQDQFTIKSGAEVEYDENFLRNYRKKQLTSRSEGNRFVKNKML